MNTRYLSLATTTFVDQLENPLVQAAMPADRDTWLGEKPLTTMVDAQVGLLVLLPR